MNDSLSIFFESKDEVCGVDPTVFRRFYHEEVEEFDEDVAEPQYIDKRCDVSRPNVLPIFQSSIRHFRLS